MKRKTLFSVVTAILCVTASADVRIVLVGDSITGLSRNDRNGYAHQMEAALTATAPDVRFEIVALGGSGQSVESWQNVELKSRTAPTQLDVAGIDVQQGLNRQADLLVVMLGMNNVLAPYTDDTPASLDGWTEHYRKLITALKARASPDRLALCSITPCTEDPESPKNALIGLMNARIQALAEEEGAAYFQTSETVWETFRRGRELKPDFHVTRDFVHPNTAGHISVAIAMLNGFGRPEAAAWLERERLQPLLRQAAEASGGVSWRMAGMRATGNGTFAFRIDYFWDGKAAGGEVPSLALNVPSGWTVEPASRRGWTGTFQVSGVPDRRENQLTLEGCAGEATRRASIVVPAPWLVAAKLPLPFWNGDNLDPVRARTPVDDAIEAGDAFASSIDVGRGRMLVWTPLFSSFDYTGNGDPDSVDFAAVTHAATFEAGYSARQVYSAKVRDVVLDISKQTFAGSTHLDVWLNGKSVYSGSLTKTNLPARLERGWNTMVFKASHRTWQWQASVGLRGIGNDTLDDLRYALPATEGH
jgi:lysophospholipase L1-like esterase